LDHALNSQLMSFDARSAGGVRDEVDVVAIPERMQNGKARQISVQRAAMTTFLRPVSSTHLTQRSSSQVLIWVRSIGTCSGMTAWRGLIKRPPLSFTTVV